MSAPEMVPFAMARRAAKRAYENGQDVALHGLGSLILDMGRAGSTDSEIITAIEDMVALRMMTGMDDAVAQLAAKEEP